MSTPEAVVTPEPVIQEWRDIPWPQVERDVHCLQRRIYRASLKSAVKVVHRLQRLLMSSRSAKLLAVRRVTQDNKGKNTAGIDGIASLEPEERFSVVDCMDLDVKPQPVRRVLIPKPGTDETRPLGMPTMFDRAMQSLVKLALEPEWEAKFEPNSYGFRPGRSCHDAIQAIFSTIKQGPKHVLDAAIAKCFDRINHDALLDKLQTFPLMRRVIKAWLKSGVLDGDTLFPTAKGTPQGGVIAPLLANIALHGLDMEIQSHFQASKRCAKVVMWKPTIIRYADDFVVLHRDEGVVRGCQQLAQEWLKDMGLELKPSKTRVGHTLNEVNDTAGFDFLGFTVRQCHVGKYHSGKQSNGVLLGYKTIIKPSKKKVKLHLEQLSAIITSMKGVPQKALIKTLNPIIKGWTLYYRTACSARTFSKVYAVLHNQLYRWAKRRQPNKSRGWIVRKYWRIPDWTFGPKEGVALRQHSDMKITRHVKVAGGKTPFAGDWKYWASRQAYYPGITPWLAMLLKRQRGRCSHCKTFFMPGDLLEVHHTDQDHSNNKKSNLEAMHRHCHDKIHGPGTGVKFQVRIVDND